MLLAQLRDLVVVIFAVLGIGAFLLFISLMIILYRKVGPILDTARSTFGDIRGTSSFVSDTLVKPLIKLVSLASGTRKAIGFLMKFSRRKERKGG